MAKSGKRTTKKTMSQPALEWLRKPPRMLGFPLSLTVQSMRCFGEKPQRLDLSDGTGRPARWTLLLGNNGTGKTTLLEALASLCVGHAAVTLDGTDVFVLEAIHPTSRIRETWRPARSPDALVEMTCEYCSGWRFTKPLTSPTRHKATAVLNKAAGINKGSVSLGAGLYCFGYGPTRRLGDSTLTKSESDDPCASLFSEDANLRNAEELLLRLDYSANKPSKVKMKHGILLNKVKKALCDLLPDVSEIRINEPTKKSPTSTVEFETPYGWVGLTSLGQGYRSLIAWVVDFAGRMFDAHPKSKNPLAEPAVVLVDEIDLHLHPTWQRRVMNHLSERFPNTQFIATAHSPLIAQAADEANVALLQREDDHVIIRNHMKPMRGARLDQVVTSELYGLQTARPPHLEEMIERRRKLLTKSRLTKKDKLEIKKLEDEIGPLPVGETEAEAQKLQGIVEQTQALLEKYKD